MQSCGSGGTANFTAYVNPYLVVRNGGEYTKHIYMGGQRITSKVSNSGIFSTSPVKDTLQAKYATQTATLKSRYDSLNVQYKGTEHSGSIISNAPTTASSSYFYHSDHLGSTSLITDMSGDIVQHVEYVPFGGTFIDERRSINSWHTPFLFSGKERDIETGLLYVSQRYQDEKYGIWYSVDQMAEEFPNVSSYVYCNNNPIVYVDPDGRKSKKPSFNGITNISNVLSDKKWIPYMSKTIQESSWNFSWKKGFYETISYKTGECADYSRLQVAQGSNKYTAVGSKNRIDMFVKSGADDSKLDLQKGINVIIKNLKQGRAIMAGVMYDRNKNTGNANSATNHYVTIVGMGEDSEGFYFSYYDNYTGEGHTEQTKESVGTDIKLNKFRLTKDSKGNYYFADRDNTLPYNQNNNVEIGNPENRPARYIVTEVRDNI